MGLPRHLLLLSADPYLLEALSRPLHAVWPDARIDRAHPAGGVVTPRLVLSRPDALAIVDGRSRIKPEILKLLQAYATAGGTVVELVPVPRTEADLAGLRDPARHGRFDLLAHSLPWDSTRLADAIVAARAGTGLRAEGLGPEGHLNNPKLKGEFIAGMTTQLEALHVQRTWRSKIASVVDELLMNALYHAPQSPDGSLLERDAGLKWIWAADRGFSATVWDECGTYRREDALRKIRDFLNHEMVQITRTSGRGGGVGLFLVLKTANEYILFIEPGARTEVSVRIAAGVGNGPGTETDSRGHEILAYFRREN